MAADRDPFESTRMSLGEHLAELRKRLFRGVLAVLLAFGVGMAYYKEIGRFVLRPLNETIEKVDRAQVEKYEKILRGDPARRRSEFFTSDDPANRELQPRFTIEKRPIVTSVVEPFKFAMLVSIVFALAAGAPVLLWQMWQFIAAGLYPREKRVVRSYFPASVLLFAAGVVFGFTVLLPVCMYFMVTAYDVEEMQALLSINEYWRFLSSMTLALGLIFQLPVVMFALVHIDLVQRSSYARFRPYFIVLAFVFAGIITPPDPVSQPLLALPMVALYELGMLVTLPLARRRAKAAQK